jgi:hypothetical protein
MTRRIYLQLVLCSFFDELTDPTLHTPLATAILIALVIGILGT